MLQYRTVEPGTLDVLKDLMALHELQDFYLVGGTALSLYYGHRLSVDIDLFSVVDFKAELLIPLLEKRFPGFAYSNPNNPVGLFGYIGDVKVDFVKHSNFPLIATPHIENGIRLMNPRDIAAMKVAAVLRRAVKKDFWDIAELLDHFSSEELIKCYNEKYPNQQLLISIPQALTYFSDAEESADPVSLKGQTWKKIKMRIQNKMSEYLK